MILTAGVIVMILVAMSYASNIMNLKLAENEFVSTKQFMSSTVEQMDDIAWTIERTQTVTYASRFGALKYQPAAITYDLSIHTAAGWDNQTLSAQTGILLFNIPIGSYSMGNNYFERVPFSANGSFLLSGSSAPVGQVFCEEKLPMNDGSYLRVALVPTMRVLSNTIENGQNYLKFYMPSLDNAISSYNTQGLTLRGAGISKVTHSGVDCIIITANYPLETSGFDSDFFNFDRSTIILNSYSTPKLSSNSVVEFYTGHVNISIGGS